MMNWLAPRGHRARECRTFIIPHSAFIISSPCLRVSGARTTDSRCALHLRQLEPLAVLACQQLVRLLVGLSVLRQHRLAIAVPPDLAADPQSHVAQVTGARRAM